jgi:hypothetical protein
VREIIVRKKIPNDVTRVPEVGRTCVFWHSDVNKWSFLLFKIRNGVKCVSVVSHGENSAANIMEVRSALMSRSMRSDVFVGCDVAQHYWWFC